MRTVGAAVMTTVLAGAVLVGYATTNGAGPQDLAAIGVPPASVSASASPSPSASPSVDPGVAVRDDVAADLAQYGSHASFALLDQVTGEQILYQEDAAFETASVVKVDILATLLWQEQQTGTSPSQSQQQLATAMITESDNDAATDLWDQIGGASGLTAANAVFGLTETTPGQDGSWGVTTTTAADQLRLLQLITSSSGPLDSASRGFLLGLMNRVEDDQRWGVPDAAGTQATDVYVKNGWMPSSADGGAWVINSVGRIVEPGHDWLVVVLSDDNSTQASGTALVQHVADLAVQNLRSSA
jgi:beta-lactamase class A